VATEGHSPKASPGVQACKIQNERPDWRRIADTFWVVLYALCLSMPWSKNAPPGGDIYVAKQLLAKGLYTVESTPVITLRDFIICHNTRIKQRVTNL